MRKIRVTQMQTTSTIHTPHGLRRQPMEARPSALIASVLFCRAGVMRRVEARARRMPVREPDVPALKRLRASCEQCRRNVRKATVKTYDARRR